MNREIKFRAWNKHKNKMINSVAILGIWEKFVTGFDRDYIHNSQDWGSQEDFAYDFELMQFTGLQDKNGKDIYEGDILSPISSEMYPYWVEFDDGEFCLYSKYGRWGSISKMHPTCDRLNIKINIIGNIYENQELLK